MVRANDTTPVSGFDARGISLAGLVAALLAASAWVTIPVGAVPVTLQVFIVLLAGLLLRPGAATVAVAAYVGLGAIGAPVFAGGTGGLGVLAGPTGGYLVGFIAAASAVSAVRLGLETTVRPAVADGIASAVGIVAIYAVGCTQLSLATGMGCGAAFAAGVAPFLLPDAAKAAVAVGVAASVRRAGVL
jgi:biotin transport system substrate-specific component